MFNISDLILKQAQHPLVNYVLSIPKDLKYEISGEELEPRLHLVEIYFDTATFDDIEQDKKVKFEAQLSLVGGTMGLLTGFSIISGIETIYFLFRLSWPSQFIKPIMIFLIQAAQPFQHQKDHFG